MFSSCPYSPTYHAAEPAYPYEPSPQTVADDYSKAAFDHAETADGAGTVTGSYSVALPDGRTQHVNYKADGYEGYVADVTYEGTAVYPDAPVAYKAAPVPAYAGQEREKRQKGLKTKKTTEEKRMTCSTRSSLRLKT